MKSSLKATGYARPDGTDTETQPRRACSQRAFADELPCRLSRRGGGEVSLRGLNRDCCAFLKTWNPRGAFRVQMVPDVGGAGGKSYLLKSPVKDLFINFMNLLMRILSLS